jgi:RNA polymerase sigma-70 factor (ECF subfamily)
VTDNAVREAYQAYYRRLVGQAFALTADLAEAEDVVQEAFARVVARPRQFLAATSPESWLRVVVLNVARTRYRRRWLFDHLVRAGRIEASPASVPGLTPDRVAVLAALRRLPPATRETIVLHHVADLPIGEVADLLGVPVGTVKARLSRGRAALARLLNEDTTTDTAPKGFRHA